MKKGLRWTDVPLIIFGGSLIALATIYVFTGTNMLHDVGMKANEADGSRWLTLLGMTVASGFVCGFNR